MTNRETSAIVDAVLRMAMFSGVLTLATVSPNLLTVLDKPLHRAIRKLDQRSYQREINRVISYMSSQGLIEKPYEHGIVATNKGLKRIMSRSSGLGSITISKPAIWDNLWRIIIYDIPESNRYSREKLARKLNQLGFMKLQKSVWVYPHPCRAQLVELTTYLGVASFVTYFESPFIDNERLLISRFKSLGTM